LRSPKGKEKKQRVPFLEAKEEKVNVLWKIDTSTVSALLVGEES
jgi:hypothetical protein